MPRIAGARDPAADAAADAEAAVLQAIAVGGSLLAIDLVTNNKYVKWGVLIGQFVVARYKDAVYDYAYVKRLEFAIFLLRIWPLSQSGWTYHTLECYSYDPPLNDPIYEQLR